MIRNKLLLILAMLALTLGVKAEWKDVTSIFITNPGFYNDSPKGWTWTSNASSQTVRAGCMEFWNGTFDIGQDLSGLPEGHYRLTVQSYYRPADNDASYNNYISGTSDSEMTGYLYAGSAEQKIVSVYSYEFPEWVEGCWTYSSGSWWGGGETHYFPNTMESAADAFQRGAYENVMEFDASGTVRIGLRCAVNKQGNWCIFDNFKLEYSGDAVEVQKITFSSEKTELVVGDTMRITAKVTPENALNKVLAWTSSNMSVATVDESGLVTALSAGTVTIKATATDGSNKSATMTLNVKRNEVAADKLFINEIMVSNVDEFISPAFNFDGWMELYNASDKPLSLSGMYLSDDATNLLKWRLPVQAGVLPAKGYKVIWFDSNDIASQNAPFSLDVDGGFIHLSDDTGKLIVSQYYPSGTERVSYARTTDGGDTWGTTGQPTPGASNASSKFANTQLAAPQIDQPSKFFDGSLTATVTIPLGTTLRYTLDGSLPTETRGSVSKTGIFQFNKTTNLRMRLFADGCLPSRVTTRSYIMRNKDYYLPVVSVVGDDDFFNSTEIGVFQKGPNGRPGNGQAEKCNWNMNWERPVNFSYIEADGEMVLNQDVNLEMCGGWSRAWLPHSFKLKGSKEMGGNKHLPYTFFVQKPYIRNRTIQIRNGGNENNTRLKDGALGYILQTSGIDVDVQSYQPVHEFINGQYIGVLNVREPNNKHYIYANYGWDDDEIDQFEIGPDSGYAQKCGTADSFEELIILSESSANSETYEELCRRIDMDEYVNYMAAEFYLGGTDWPQNNVKGFAHKDNGKYRFVFFDVDFAFNSNDPFNLFLSKEWYLFNELYPAGQDRIYDQIKFVTLFKNMLNNDNFRRKFTDAFCLMGGSVYEAGRATEIVNMLSNNVEAAMNLEGRSVTGSANDIKNKLNSRLTMATNYLQNFDLMQLWGETPQNVSLASDVEAGRLLINGQQVPTGYFKGKLFQPVTLEAVAPAGYVFQGWINHNATTSTTLKAMGSLWSYYDQGSLDGKYWTSRTYNSSSWSTGNAPLGYSNTAGIITTTLDYGNDSNNKRPTYYFRSSVTLSEAPASTDVFTMDYYIDDGLVVYVNGTEAARFNMPSGTISYTTLASTYADQFPTGTLTLPTSLFKKGTNVIAVEVHNNANNSSDIIFDAAIKKQSAGESDSYYSTDAEIELPEGDVVLTASYRVMTQQERQAKGINPVRINEVSGSNNSLINEYGKKSDWVELYNTTDQEIDVEGMYLTDNLSKPEKYKITKGTTQAKTIIPAHGYLLVWCDKLATTDQGLHASFKIDGEGGVIALKAADKSWTDEVYYGAHDANTTVGRYPDGAEDIYMMNVTTIAASNLLTSNMELTDQEELKKVVTGTRMTIASANGFRIRFGSQQLLIKSEDATSADVAIYTSDGRLVERNFVDLNNGTARLSVAHLPAGFYVARATDEQGNRVGCKFMR